MPSYHSIYLRHTFFSRIINEVQHKKGDPMRIAILQNVTLNDHRSVHTHNVACELHKRGVRVDVILQKTDKPLQFTDRPYNLIHIPGETYSIPGQITFMKASLAVLKKRYYDIIHSKNPFSSVFSPLLLRTLRIIRSKIVYDMRGLWVDFGVHAGQFSPGMGKILNAIDGMMMHWCDHIITISPVLEQILISRGISPDTITTIKGSGVNIQEIEKLPSESVEDLLGISGTIIGYIGTISVSRHSDRLIHAFLKVRRQKKDCHLVLIGPEDGTVRHLFSAKNVHWLGAVPNERALSLLKSFHLAVAYHDRVNPFFNVAVPIKILEYMAAGIPIVTTNHPMYSNILVHKKTGYLTPLTPERFAWGILTVLNSDELQKRLVDQARKEITHYSIQSLVDQLEVLYSHLMDHSG